MNDNFTLDVVMRGNLIDSDAATVVPEAFALDSLEDSSSRSDSLSQASPHAFKASPQKSVSCSRSPRSAVGSCIVSDPPTLSPINNSSPLHGFDVSPSAGCSKNSSSDTAKLQKRSRFPTPIKNKDVVSACILRHCVSSWERGEGS